MCCSLSGCLRWGLSETRLLWEFECVRVFYPSVQEKIHVITSYSFLKDRKTSMEGFKEDLKLSDPFCSTSRSLSGE